MKVGTVVEQPFRSSVSVEVAYIWVVDLEKALLFVVVVVAAAAAVVVVDAVEFVDFSVVLERQYIVDRAPE